MQSRSPDCVARHRNYIQCLKDTGVIPVMGRFKKKDVYCRFCKKRFTKYEEKETDVAISLKLIELFITKECDIVTLMTGDTDLAPAVRTTQKLFPHSRILFLFPAFRSNKELSALCPKSFEINSKQYAKYQFPDPYTLENGKVIHKPKHW